MSTAPNHDQRGEECAMAHVDHELLDYALANRELDHDRRCGRLTAWERRKLICEALAIGRAAARRFHGAAPSELAARLGVTVCERAGSGEIARSRVRSEYDSGTRLITIYLESIQDVQTELDFLCPWLKERWGGVACAAARELHIAHELFHHLEATVLGRVDDILSRGARPSAPALRGTIRIKACREIAAHRFAADLVGLPFLPIALDVAPAGQSRHPSYFIDL